MVERVGIVNGRLKTNIWIGVRYGQKKILKPDRMMVVWGTVKTDTFLKYKLNITETKSQV